MSEQQHLDYYRIEKAIKFIAKNQISQPSLDEIASAVNLSPHHLQRLFTRWAGISPKKFLQYLTLEKSRERLASGTPLTEVAYYSGLSGTGPLHDLYVRFEGVTPGQARGSGSGVIIYYGIFNSPFGDFLLGITDKGAVCWLSFITSRKEAISELRARWENAVLIQDSKLTAPVAETILSPIRGGDISIHASGTPFQLKVWEALLKIPFGSLVTYQEIAGLADNPKALQAVGSAIGSNPVAFLIPCHRVIRKTGNINQYRWGLERKMALIGWEGVLAGKQ